jgi:hypothetical protein
MPLALVLPLLDLLNLVPGWPDCETTGVYTTGARGVSRVTARTRHTRHSSQHTRHSGLRHQGQRVHVRLVLVGGRTRVTRPNKTDQCRLYSNEQCGEVWRGPEKGIDGRCQNEI